MKLAVDAFPLIVRSGGIQRYAYEMIRRLPLLIEGEVYLQGLRQPVQECRLTGGTTDEVRNNLDRLIAANVIPVSSGLRDWLRPLQSTFIGDLWFDRRLKQARREIEEGGIDLYWGTNYFAPTSKMVRSIVTVHDLVHIDCPQWVNPAVLRQLRRHFQGCAEGACHVVAVSEFTKRRLIEACGVSEEKVNVIHNAIGPEFRVIDDQERLDAVKSKYQLAEKFVLFVSTLEPRKNVVGLLNGYIESDVWKEGVELVLVGARGWKSEEIFRRLQELQKNYPIRWLENVPHQDLPAIYNLARGFVFPSHYEGFGIPIIEAEACGCRVMTSVSTACREVAGRDAILVDEQSAKEIGSGIRRVLEMQASFHRPTFSWDESAVRLAELFKIAISK